MAAMPIQPLARLASVILFDYMSLKVWNSSRLAPGPGADSRCVRAALAAFTPMNRRTRDPIAEQLQVQDHSDGQGQNLHLLLAAAGREKRPAGGVEAAASR